MSLPKSVIVSCAGTTLTTDERRLFGQANPFGLILFGRNIESPNQVRALTDEFRACVGRVDAPVLIDQEGGAVARLRAPQWEEFPSASVLGDLYRIDPVRGIAAAKILGRMLASQLAPLGITVNCAPVLDLPAKDASRVIGSRAFSADHRAVTALGRALCDGLRVGGVLPVIKHIPGHGRALADSHFELPSVTASLDTLEGSDFLPFQNLFDMPMAMTAHVLFTEIDPEQCATLSPKVIEGLIRQQLHFGGLLITDDICMQALKGHLPTLARQAIEAGCDLALVCQNNKEYPYDTKLLAEVIEAVPVLSDATQKRWQNAQEWLSPIGLFDPKLARAEFNHLIPEASRTPA